jgi:LuxR family transcriptional regulator, maltose regulon positive regulatory protein
MRQRTGSLIEIQALRALALAGDGDEPGGIAALVQALRLAYPEGMSASSPTKARPRGRPGGAVVPGLVEQLSVRELEVPALLAAGRSNQEIAEELVVSLNTVKKHVTHILDKLGAANRTGAVTRARELGLLGWPLAGWFAAWPVTGPRRG